MSISSIINNYYLSKVAAANNTTNNANTQNTADAVAKVGLTDEFSLSTPDLSGYLNYGADGQYGNQASLVDLFNQDSGSDTNSSEDDLTALFGNSGMNNLGATSLVDLFNTDSSNTDTSDSFSNMFEGLIQSKMTEINDLIAKVTKQGNTANSNSTPNDGTSPGENVTKL